MTMRSEGRSKLALVGAGAIAQSYARAFQSSQSADVVAVVDVDIERARVVSAPLGAVAISSYAQMLAEVECDGVIICTPPTYHMEMAIDALNSGIHVLCEKPLAIGAFAARRMFAAAADSGSILTMASKFRFVADIVRAKELMDAGTVGDILRVENSFTSCTDMTARWNSRLEISGGGVVIDNGTHSVDIMRFLLGPLTTVYAVDTSADRRYDRCEDSASLFVRSASGVTGVVVLSWRFQTGDSKFLRIFGTQGTINVGWSGSEYTVGNKTSPFGQGYVKEQAFAAQIENFVGAIRGTAVPAISREDAIASVTTIDAAYDSMRRSIWSDVEVRRLTPFEKLICAPAKLVGSPA